MTESHHTNLLRVCRRLGAPMTQVRIPASIVRERVDRVCDNIHAQPVGKPLKKGAQFRHAELESRILYPDD